MSLLERFLQGRRDILSIRTQLKEGWTEGVEDGLIVRRRDYGKISKLGAENRLEVNKLVREHRPNNTIFKEAVYFLAFLYGKYLSMGINFKS